MVQYCQSYFRAVFRLSAAVNKDQILTDLSKKEPPIASTDRRSFVQAAALLLISRAEQWAWGDTAFSSVPWFKIQRVSKHVYAAIAQPAPVVYGNSAFIVTE